MKNVKNHLVEASGELHAMFQKASSSRRASDAPKQKRLFDALQMVDDAYHYVDAISSTRKEPDLFAYATGGHRSRPASRSKKKSSKRTSRSRAGSR